MRVTTEHDYEFPATSDTPALGAMRAWVRSRLAHLGEDTVQDAEMVATELITNAYLHAAGPRALRLQLRDDRLVVRIEVDDASPHLLPPSRDQWDAAGTEPGGRGLPLVDAMAAAWGVFSAPGRKTTWVELPLA